MRKFGQVPKRRCPYCKRMRPSYLYESHLVQCAAEQNRRQQERQVELLAELKAV